MIRVALIEDIESIRKAQENYLNAQEDVEVVLSEGSVEEFQRSMQEQPEAVQIVISDIGLPGMNGIEGVKWIKKHYPETDVIMLSVFTDSDNIYKALCSGAVGYLQKNTPLSELYKSIITVLNGGSPMTPDIARKVVERFNPKRNHDDSALSQKEHQVVDCIVEGLSYKLVADRLGISINTVRHHIRNIYRKLQVNSKAQIISKSFNDEIN
ncbi:MAG: response regulator transcription factor [Crocinitomicaceae bacterium]